LIPIRILLVEDEPRVQKFVKKALEQTGMAVDTLDKPESIEVMLFSNEYEVLILDRLLKTTDTLYSLPLIRQRLPHLKILILSALTHVNQRIQGLEYGADDYLGKPFHIEELASATSKRNSLGLSSIC